MDVSQLDGLTGPEEASSSFFFDVRFSVHLSVGAHLKGNSPKNKKRKEFEHKKVHWFLPSLHPGPNA